MTTQIQKGHQALKPSGDCCKAFDMTNVEKQVGGILVSRTILGQGSTAIVKLGYSTKHRKQVAVKIVEKGTLTPLGRENLAREVRIHQYLSQFNHPNIIQLYDIVEDERYLHMVLEYANGGDLVSYIERKVKLTEEEARPLFKMILDAVSFLHQRNISHRDIKAENFLLCIEHDNTITLKLSDFGLAMSMEQGALFDTPCGSPCYAAPEIVTRRSYSGRMADVWAMGILLYTMLCGKFPFSHPNILALFGQIKQGQYTTPSHLSSPAQDIIKKMLTKDLEQRITVDQIYTHEWLVGPQTKRAEPSDNMRPVPLPKTWLPLELNCSS
jgi:serine/threonine protein kinase